MTDETPPDDRDGYGLSGREAELTCELDPDERPSRAVVRAVASLTNTPVLDLDPLYETIDPDHLNGLCGRDDACGQTGARAVTFEFSGCTVTVEGEYVHARVHRER